MIGSLNKIVSSCLGYLEVGFLYVGFRTHFFCVIHKLFTPLDCNESDIDPVGETEEKINPGCNGKRLFLGKRMKSYPEKRSDLTVDNPTLRITQTVSSD